MQAKKSLGQNFLNSRAVAKNIVRAAELTASDTVLEIGPGKGFLTTELLESGARVMAVEKDDRMIPLLSEKFADQIKGGQLTIVHADILEDQKSPAFAKGRYKVVANIPYYITGQILRMFLSADKKPERMILMVQKEVAERIVVRAKNQKESILSLAVKAYGAPRIVQKVPARYFTPAPKVDSAVLAIENISGKNFQNKTEEDRFFTLIKTGFAHKRKLLAGNLREAYGDTKEILAETGVSPSARAEDVPLERWLLLARRLR